MDIYFSGLTSVRLRGKKTALVIDPFTKEKTGKKFEKTEADAILLTSKNSPYTSLQQVANYRVVIDGPGEYETGGVSILGIPLSGVTTYYIKMDAVTLLHVGALKNPLVESDFDKYPNIDILFVLFGGDGAISGKEAADMVTKFEPKIVVPMYVDGAQPFLKEVGKEHVKPQPKLSITKDKLPQELEVVWLS